MRSSSAEEARKKSVAEEPVTSVLTDGEVPIFERELNADEEVLAALGYKYETASFPFVSILSLVSFSFPLSCRPKTQYYYHHLIASW